MNIKTKLVLFNRLVHTWLFDPFGPCHLINFDTE